jgi:hypothetical protein
MGELMNKNKNKNKNKKATKIIRVRTSVRAGLGGDDLWGVIIDRDTGRARSW